jgi:hypothetical protein
MSLSPYNKERKSKYGKSHDNPCIVSDEQSSFSGCLGFAFPVIIPLMHSQPFKPTTDLPHWHIMVPSWVLTSDDAIAVSSDLHLAAEGQ